MSQSKVFDVVVFGATGFTGQLVARYLSRLQTPIRFALAGRNEAKLSELKRTLGDDTGADPAVLLASSTDADALERVAAQTKVVLTTAGPFLQHGPPLVEACLKHHTDYCDITGETPFVRRVIDQHSQAAADAGVLLVSMCGFDSVPSDLGAWRTVRRVRDELGEDCRRVDNFVAMRGSLSGGTLESGLRMDKQPELATMVADPFLLGGQRMGGVRNEDKDPSAAAYSALADAWTAPFMMASLNTRVVRRTCGLFEEYGNMPTGYGGAFAYQEVQVCPNEDMAHKLARGAPPPEKREQMREQGRLPKPGEGPSPEERAKSWFKMTFVGEGASSGRRLATSVSGKDPGYDETSKMVSEAALCMALQRDELPGFNLSGQRGGVWTPSFAFGDVLVRRLRAAGMTFVDDEPIPGAK